MLNVESIRDYCLSKVETVEAMPFGDSTLVFKVRNKIFLLLPLDSSLRINVKADKADKFSEKMIFNIEEAGKVNLYWGDVHVGFTVK